MHALRLRLRSLFQRTRVDDELDAEIRFHIEQLVSAGLARGSSPEEARRAALLAMDGVQQQKEKCRDTRRLNLVDDLAKDIRYAMRTLRRTPGFTIAAVMSLTLGLGANTAVFSVVNAILLKPLDYRDPDRLVVVGEEGGTTVSAATFLEWRGRNLSFERIGAAEYWTPNLAGSDRAEQIYALHLSADVLPLLGVQPIAGRIFTSEEEHVGRDHVVVLGYRLWTNRFAADPAVIGRTMTLDSEAYTIVGVMPASFRFAPFWATKAELWAPLTLDARKADRGASLRIFARLKPDVSVSRARAEMTALTAALDTARGDTPGDVSITPLHQMVVGDVKPALLVLLTATGLVLLIACANVAHLQLVRGATRAREIALRSALGASRLRVVRQLLTESAIVCVAGGVCGLLMARQGVKLLVAMAPPGIPRLANATIDSRVFLFMLTVSVCAGVAFGLVPAVRAARVDVTDSLKGGGSGSIRSGAPVHLRSALVVSEFAMAMLLLICAGLIIRSFFGLLAVDSGFDPRNVVAMEVSVAGTTKADPARRAEFFRELVARVRSLPGVEAASAINHLPLIGDRFTFRFAVEGRPPLRRDDLPTATYRVVLPGYFSTMRIPVRKGRDFTEHEHDVLAAPHVVVINEFMARRHWPNQDPLGRRIAAGSLSQPDWCTIVGVVTDVKQASWAEANREEMYFPYLQAPLYLGNQRFSTYLSLVALSSRPTAALALADAAVRNLEPRAVVTKATTMEEAIAGELVAPRFYMLLLGIFAAVALMLAAVGIYGVISHSVARRTREIGVRIALGATRREIFDLVVRHGLLLSSAGTAIGCACALLATRYMRTLLFGVEPIDPATFGLVALILMAVALVACYVPARRAMTIEPTTALRCE